MTYAQFHFLFNLPLLLILWYFGGKEMPSELSYFILILLGMVVLFTSPWDNWAVKRGIWGFSKERFWFKIGYLPLEEYLFFLIETMEVIWLVEVLIHRSLPSALARAIEWNDPLFYIPCCALLVTWLSVWFKYGNHSSRWNYAWHLLFWFLPVIFFQWILAWPIFLNHLSTIFWATAGIGTYLSLADWIAVRQGIWFFDEKQITGLKFSSILPWEEVAFFYLTSLLVAQSYVILLPAYLR